MATINSVQGTDTPNQGRVKWNDNDTALNADIAAGVAALNTHKGSDDHDSRYYTETEINTKVATIDGNLATHKASTDHDAAYVKKTGDESVGGNKTFSNDVIINRAAVSAVLKLKSVSGSIEGRTELRSDCYSSPDYHSGGLRINIGTDENPIWKWIVWRDSHSNVLMTEEGEVATKAWATERIKSGTFVLTGGLNIAAAAANTEYPFKNPSAGNLRFLLPRSSTLRQVSISAISSGNVVYIWKKIAANEPFNNIESDVEKNIYRWIEPVIKTGANNGGILIPQLVLYKGMHTDSDPYMDVYVKSEFFNSQFTDKTILNGSAYQFDVTLLFSL